VDRTSARAEDAASIGLGLESPATKRAPAGRATTACSDGCNRSKSLPPEKRRQLIRIVDAFIERGQLKRRANSRTSG
jgi:hypothetical protein